MKVSKRSSFAFAIIGGKEMFLHQAIRAGLAERIENTNHNWLGEFFPEDFSESYYFSSDSFYRTNVRYWKLFMSVQGVWFAQTELFYRARPI